MGHMSRKTSIPVIVFLILIVSVSTTAANAETIPEWVKNNALWYGQGIISETEFLNAIKFLIENDVLVIDDSKMKVSKNIDATVIIPNGNSDIANVGFYLPLNLEIPVGTTVTWVNDDSVSHNIQSQDDSGKVIDIFNSPPLNTGDRFKYTFEEEGVYKYHCSWHPWRVGLVTVN
jgi:plastocyanin